MAKRNLTLILVFLIVSVIGGCRSTSNQWGRPGGTQQQLHSDRSFCIQKSNRYAVAGAGSDSSGRALLGLIVSNNSFANCMAELGWQPGVASFPEQSSRNRVSGIGGEEIIPECQQAISLIRQRMRVTYTSIAHCSAGIWTGNGTTILQLSDFARQARLAPGDTVIRIGSVANPTAEEIVDQIRNSGPHDTIAITVKRDSENIVTTANCEDGLASSVELNAAFDAASQGRWADCIFRSHEYEREIGYVSSGPAGLRFVCNECSRISGDQRFDAAGAILAYQFAILKLEEARFSMSISRDVHDGLIDISALLRDSGFDLYANHIDTMLAQVATEPDSGEQPGSFNGGTAQHAPLTSPDTDWEPEHYDGEQYIPGLEWCLKSCDNDHSGWCELCDEEYPDWRAHLLPSP
jgi:hypothetical protein